MTYLYQVETERVIRGLVAILYAVKNHLRAEWRAPLRPPGAVNSADDDTIATAGFSDLVPEGNRTFEEYSLGLPFTVDILCRGKYQNGL